MAGVSDMDSEALCHTSPSFKLGCQYLDTLANRENHIPKVLLTFYHILLVVTIVVAVCGSIIDIKSMDWGVVVTCWNIL